jgi:hypothetical protein
VLLKFNSKISTGFPLMSLQRRKPINADDFGDDGDNDDDDEKSVIKVHSCTM